MSEQSDRRFMRGVLRYQWWRKLRGGYWVYTHFIGWQKVSLDRFIMKGRERLWSPEWSFENYTGNN